MIETTTPIVPVVEIPGKSLMRSEIEVLLAAVAVVVAVAVSVAVAVAGITAVETPCGSAKTTPDSRISSRELVQDISVDEARIWGRSWVLCIMCGFQIHVPPALLGASRVVHVYMRWCLHLWFGLFIDM